MSWIEKLYKTYENNTGAIGSGDIPLLPVCHTTQNAQVTVVLDGDGNFRRASVVPKTDARTIIPATEEAAGRAGSRPICFPLCDKLQYVAGDFTGFGGTVTSGFSKKPKEPHEMYLKILSDWCASPHKHSKVCTVLKYVEKGRMVKDLVDAHILHTDTEGKLLQEWKKDSGTAPEVFGVIQGDGGQSAAFVRFSVESTQGDPSSNLWTDSTVWNSWINYYSSKRSLKGLCFVTGDANSFLAEQHPAKIRNGGDKAKLISSNDTSGFTFLGRFTSSEESCGIGSIVTQKAHSALRWLIARQGRRDGDQAIVAWAVSGAKVPDPIVDTYDMLFRGQEETATVEAEYTAQEVGEALKKLVGGYSAKLDSTVDVVVMGLDSATPGRMAISFYRELTGSEFLERVLAWHNLEAGCVWRQYFGKDKIFFGAPAPRDIAECAFGKRLDEKLRNATVARLLPCIVDGVAIPRDLVESCVRRASHRQGLEYWEWEKTLGIACALYKHSNRERRYIMALERERQTRDYLYGRLLAVAEFIEGVALNVAGEGRDTNAARLMQRFADRPYSTWRSIELALVPYKTRLRSKRPGFLINMEKEHDEIQSLFQTEEYMRDNALSGEFLIAYHCERKWLWDNPKKGSSENNVTEEANNDQKGE